MEIEGTTKINPWVVVIVLESKGKIVCIKDCSGRIVLPRKEGGTLAEDLEFSPEETLEKILKENYVECSTMHISTVDTKKYSHSEIEKIFIKAEAENLRILSPNSRAGLYFLSDFFHFPSKEGDRKILKKYFT